MIHASPSPADAANAASYLAQRLDRIKTHAHSGPSAKAAALFEYSKALRLGDVKGLTQALADLRAAGIDASKLPK